jgi:hypothetical protein
LSQPQIVDIMQKRASVSIFLAISLLIAGMAVFAKELGLDPNPGWGKGRIALLVFGLLIALVPWVARKRSAIPEKAGTDLFAFPVLVVVIAVYVAFAGASRDLASNYYSLLATSFRHGELSLSLKPDPALLQLSNPYDPAARQGIKAPQDLSLYNGKFYLYWGPAPSLLLALVQPLLPGKMGEDDLLLLFMCGILLSQFLLIMHLWQRYFPEIPEWILLFCILLAGFANPALWLFTRPKIYEAAIAGAQFFFIAGFAALILSLDRQPVSRWGLAGAGTLWALAVGTRSVAVFPVAFMTLMVITWFFRQHGRAPLRVLAEMIPFGLPLLVGAVGYCWYNWARFGSFLETGLTYQLAAPYLQQHMNELFLPGYIFQNLYNYLLNPFTIEPYFPFLYPVRGVIQEILPWHLLPGFYTSQSITGILCTVPFTLFAILPILILVQQLAGKRQACPAGPAHTSELRWIILSLTGSVALPFLSLLAFFWAAMRYAEDFMPALLLLSIIGFWQGYRVFAPHVKRGRIYVTLGTILAGVSIVIAALLALSIYSSGGKL